VRRIIISLAIATLVGSPCIALGEPTSSYLAAARNAEEENDHRKAIYCLSIVLLDVLENRSTAKELDKKELEAELTKTFTKANLQDKASELANLSDTQLGKFLEFEMSNADPGKTIEVFSDGSFNVQRKPWKSPYPIRAEFGSAPSHWSSLVERGSPNYEAELKRYWWFKMPSKEALLTKPKYTPSNRETQSLPDGAFKP
jgi:hypothetical protein